MGEKRERERDVCVGGGAAKEGCDDREIQYDKL